MQWIADEGAMAGSSGCSIDVLLVEDDAVHAKLVRRAIRGFDDRVRFHHVSDGEAALQRVLPRDRAGQAVDLVLLDLRLPGVDGFEVLSAMRREPATAPIPVVIVSTSDRPDEIDRCYRLGANAYFCKPVRFDEMATLLRAMASFWVDVARARR
jgi:CheY-like chemotaxis protein